MRDVCRTGATIDQGSITETGANGESSSCKNGFVPGKRWATQVVVRLSRDLGLAADDKVHRSMF